MLSLKRQAPLFVGGTRYCFVHPEHPERCVKVLRPDRTGEVRRARVGGLKRWLPASSFDDQLKEIEAYEILLRQNNQRLWQLVPEYFGTVDTDMGVGIVTRLFSNADGSAPHNLEERLPQGMSAALDAAIVSFTDGLLREGLVTRNLLPHNVIAVQQADGSYQVLVVDGIGNSEWIPVSTWFTGFARRKVQRKITRFHARCSTLLPECDRQGVYACSS